MIMICELRVLGFWVGHGKFSLSLSLSLSPSLSHCGLSRRREIIFGMKLHFIYFGGFCFCFVLALIACRVVGIARFVGGVLWVLE